MTKTFLYQHIHKINKICFFEAFNELESETVQVFAIFSFLICYRFKIFVIFYGLHTVLVIFYGLQHSKKSDLDLKLILNF